MGKRRKPEPAAPAPDLPRFEPGTHCLILRPCLWAGHHGTVEKVDEKGIHYVGIKGLNGSVFHANVPGDQLKVVIP